MLLLSILTLFAGPFLYQQMIHGGRVVKTLDTIIVIALVVMVMFHLVPESFESLGWLALGLIALGYVLPWILETGIRKSAQTFHLMSVFLAMAGLVMHAMLDGAGLAGSAHQDSGSLALAIVLHRLSVGLLLWMIVQPVFGNKAAWSVLVIIAVATLVGNLMSKQLLPLSGQGTFMVIQALITGTIIHSLVHRGHVGHQH